MLKKTRAAMARWHQMAKKGRNTLILKTPSLAVARSSVDTEDTDLESNPREKIQSIWQKQCPKSLKEDSSLKESSKSSSEDGRGTPQLGQAKSLVAGHTF